jgi:hypothetical protein
MRDAGDTYKTGGGSIPINAAARLAPAAAAAVRRQQQQQPQQQNVGSQKGVCKGAKNVSEGAHGGGGSTAREMPCHARLNPQCNGMPLLLSSCVEGTCHPPPSPAFVQVVNLSLEGAACTSAACAPPLCKSTLDQQHASTVQGVAQCEGNTCAIIYHHH